MRSPNRLEINEKEACVEDDIKEKSGAKLCNIR